MIRVAYVLILSYVTLQSEPSASDLNIIYYVSGALARSCVRLFKCEHCKNILISLESSETTEVDGELSFSENSFLTQINRGGLSHPSHHAFMIGVHCWKVYEDIKTNPMLKSAFLSASEHRLLYFKIVQCTSD